MWSPADDNDDDNNNRDKNGPAGSDSGTGDAYALPQDVRNFIEGTIRDGLLASSSLDDDDSGVWWKALQFESPWWEHPPPVEGVLVSQD